MIKTNILFEKNKLNSEKDEHLMLIELMGEKKEKVNKMQKKLNLSLVIDISGSMALGIDGSNQYLNFFGNRSINDIEIKHSTSKLDLVKKAAINAIHNLNEGDYISVVAFDDVVELVCESVEISKNNINDIISKINSLNPRNCTNLQGGWLEGCTQVAKNFNDNYLNRVILLTDGQINSGERNTDVIVSDVLNVYNKSISTSCFGVGTDFNETLLNSMSDSGGGNFYYIEKEDDISNMFTEEFDGISNVCAFNTKLSFELNECFEIVECLNNYKQNNKFYLLPNITKNKLSILMRIKTKKIIQNKKYNLGNIIINYKDEEGKEKNITQEININTLINKKWIKLETNKELKVQEVLLSVAKNKENASIAISNGNMLRAKELLNETQIYMDSCNITDERLNAENTILGATLTSAENRDSESLKKDLFYQSYKTRTNK